MNAPGQSLWTIEELTAQVALALSVDYEGPRDGRAREVPDLRTIRYYTTLGLIDRPVAMRGRTAQYGRRHLQQIVAIKRLQAKGLTLTQLQERLVGMSDATLAEVARLPAAGTGEMGVPRRSETFWTQRPASISTPREVAPRESDLPMQGIRLSAAVTLLVAPARTIEMDDLEAIRGAAGPLLKVLEKRRLLARAEPPENVGA
jgi:DNA-binding transcriptional MerR regulator